MATPVDWFKAIEHGDISHVRDLLDRFAEVRDPKGNTGLMYATSYGHLDITRLIIPRTTRWVNDSAKTALMQCICSTHPQAHAFGPDFVALLRDHEAGVTDRQGRTALMMAAEKGLLWAVTGLAELEAGVQDTQGRTALMCAATFGQVECVEPLLHREAGLTDHRGMTALMFAAYSGRAAIAARLVPLEARRRNQSGETALDIAIWRGHQDVVAYLTEAEGGLRLALLRGPEPQEAAQHSPIRPALQHDSSDIAELRLEVTNLRRELELVQAGTASTASAGIVESLVKELVVVKRQLSTHQTAEEELRQMVQQLRLAVQPDIDANVLLNRRVDALEHSTAGLHVRIAALVDKQDDTARDDVYRCLEAVGESITQLEARLLDLGRSVAAKEMQLREGTDRLARGLALQGDELQLLRSRLDDIWQEAADGRRTGDVTADALAARIQALESRQTRLDGRTAGLVGAGSQGPSPAVERGIEHLQLSIRELRTSVESVARTVMELYHYSTQNLDSIGAAQARFMACYPAHRREYDEGRALAALQERLVRIDAYMTDQLEGRHYEKLAESILEVNARVDQLIVDRTQGRGAADLEARFQAIERALAALTSTRK